MSNKIFDSYKLSIIKNMDFSGSKKELRNLKSIILDYNNNPDVDKRNKVDKELLNFEKMYVSQNDKTGNYTENCNISSGFYCYECIKGHCKVQGGLKSNNKFDKVTCYGLANHNRLARTMTQGLVNYIVFNSLSSKEIEEQILEAIEKHNSYYLRFNEIGSFFSLKSFKKCDKTAKSLKDQVISYSYTSNKRLFDKVHKNSHMTLSLSQGFANPDEIKVQDFKQTIVIPDNYESIKPLLEDDRFRFCNESCSNCCQCKDKDDKRITVFIQHGAGHKYKLKNAIGTKAFLYQQREGMFRNMAFIGERLL